MEPDPMTANLGTASLAASKTRSRGVPSAGRYPALVLQVGLPKTATKTLQIAFQVDRSLCYVHTPGAGRPHSRAFANFLGVGWDVLRTADAHAPFRAELLTRLRGRSNQLRIISDETLCHVGKIDWDRFAALLDELPGPIRIVLVIRPFFSWLESLLIQFTKNDNLDFAAFDPDQTEVLNGYPLSFLEIHDAYTALARRIGRRARVDCLPYSDDMCATMGAYLGREIVSPEGEVHSHVSPTAFLALAECASRRGVIDRLPLRPPARFIGRMEAQALYARHQSWMRDLAGRLGWADTAIDDYETFMEKAEDFSYLRYAREHFTAKPLPGTVTDTNRMEPSK